MLCFSYKENWIKKTHLFEIQTRREKIIQISALFPTFLLVLLLPIYFGTMFFFLCFVLLLVTELSNGIQKGKKNTSLICGDYHKIQKNENRK